MFSRVELNKTFDVRKEEEQVVLFSGNTRDLHFISNDAYSILELAYEKDFQSIKNLLCDDQDDQKALTEFFYDLKRKDIIKFMQK
ncbi:MAG: hypothetical protein SPH93_05575 [Clostridium sp.]|uniref:hypothetical protein n=1 Tax=Clostridium sp. TaxID=1506 RepID=UPI002A9106CF|nr:hypothetical protein [Clostridium sp.]MDY6227133.1 hypothetical protein [Clostridium sp.]